MTFKNIVAAGLASALAVTAALAPVYAEEKPAGVDPLDARVRSEDARRFVAVFEAADGAPTAEQLQAGYLDGAGRGVEIFTPSRIVDAENLAATIAADPAKYRRAIDVCLPIAEAASTDLRSIYLGLKGLFPDQPLPDLYVVFGAGNSGGTAGSDAQVLGLEVICEIGETPEEIRDIYRGFFAHETVHVLQHGLSNIDWENDPLLAASLAEGMADYVAWLVTGEVPTPSRDAWAREHEAEVWEAFHRDMAVIAEELAAGATFDDPTPRAEEAWGNWVGNYRNAPEGWPHEMGYWVGRQIINAYVDQAEDRRAAFAEAMVLENPRMIYEASGYASE